MRLFLLSIAAAVTLPAQIPLPRILQIYQDRLKPGREGAYESVEDKARQACERLMCPNPYLAITSISGPSQVWFLNGYDSAESMEKVAADYAVLPGLDELSSITGPKADWVYPPRTILARYRDDLSRGAAGINSYTRYLSIRRISVNPGHLQDFVDLQKNSQGRNRLIYEVFSGMPDGTFFAITPMRQMRESVSDIEQAGNKDVVSAAIGGSEALLFGLSPSMSFVSKEWKTADAEFWK